MVNFDEFGSVLNHFAVKSDGIRLKKLEIWMLQFNSKTYHTIT